MPDDNKEKVSRVQNNSNFDKMTESYAIADAILLEILNSFEKQSDIPALKESKLEAKKQMTNMF